jgi:probable F420-dependent oxidoreductase
MQIGIVYPQIEVPGDAATARLIGQTVEQLGFHHLVAYDHVLGAVHEDREPRLSGPYTERDPFHDPFMLFAYLAGITERIEFVTGVLILPQRQTALVARQAADVALFSGDRFRLGVGIGWNYVEYDALGQSFRTRGAREEEQIGLLRLLWENEVVQFDGTFDHIDRAGIPPRPVRPIPIWLGGHGEPAMQRAARLGDGFIFSNRPGSDISGAWDRVRELVTAAGRPLADFGGEYFIRSKGDADDVVSKLEAWEKAGGTHASVVTMDRGLDSAAAHVDFIAEVAAALDGKLAP